MGLTNRQIVEILVVNETYNRVIKHAKDRTAVTNMIPQFPFSEEQQKQINEERQRNVELLEQKEKEYQEWLDQEIEF